MAGFKCKYCGNSLHPEEGQTIITCGRCDETTRIIATDNIKKQRLLEEASELRFACLFDRAMQRYENVIHEFPMEADAYWGYVLCIYGVEFQEDTRSGKRLPTLHRISTKSILQDPYYQKAIEYANPIDAKDYERIAMELDRIRQRFLELSQKEENKYDIFISFKQTDDRYHRETIDCSKAENLYHKLKEMGYRVFFSKVTLASRGGEDYEPIIYTALETAKIMIVIGSSRDNLEAPWVRNEWNRYLNMMQNNCEKKILPVYFGEMTPDKLPEALRGIQGYDIDTQRGVDRVLSRVEQLLPKIKQDQAEASGTKKEFAASEKSILKRAEIEMGSKNWNMAAEHYNRVLDVNPECAMAWVGLMLCDAQFTSLDEYKEYLLDKYLTVEPETQSVSEYGNEDEDLVVSNVVPNYLSEEDIIDILPENLLYKSTYKSMCKNQLEVTKFFKTNQNYKHALDCAETDYKEKLVEFKEDITKKLFDARIQAKVKDDEVSSRLKKEYKNQLDQALTEIQKRHQEAIEQRESDYKKAMEVRTSSAVPEAIKCLFKVGKYQEAPQKLKKLINLQNTKELIGDGSTFLVQQLLDENPQAVENLQNAMMHVSEKPGGIKTWIALGLYCFILFAFVVKPSVIPIVCMVFGSGLGVFLWKRNQPYIAYLVYAIFHTIAGVFFSTQWMVIMPAIYIISFIRPNGYVRRLISRKLEIIAVDEAKKTIDAYEAIFRRLIDEIWEEAIGVQYDGVKMQSILETLEKHNYMMKDSITSKANKVSNNKFSDLANRDVQNESEGFDMNEFEEMFQDLMNMEDDDDWSEIKKLLG